MKKEGEKKDKETLIMHCLSTAPVRGKTMMTRMEEMSASRTGLKAELHYHDICEEEDLSNLVTIFRNAAKILNFHYARSIKLQCKET